VTPKGKLSNTFAKKIVIVKNMKELLLDSTPKTMEAKDIIQKAKEKTITHTNIKVHHILGILRFNFTIPLLFGFFFKTCINSNYYITNNNTINEIVISNQTKLYITCVCSFIEEYIFQTKPFFYFEKTLHCTCNFNFDRFKQCQNSTLSHKNNKSHHKCTKITSHKT